MAWARLRQGPFKVRRLPRPPHFCDVLLARLTLIFGTTAPHSLDAAAFLAHGEVDITVGRSLDVQDTLSRRAASYTQPGGRFTAAAESIEYAFLETESTDSLLSVAMSYFDVKRWPITAPVVLLSRLPSFSCLSFASLNGRLVGYHGPNSSWRLISHM